MEQTLTLEQLQALADSYAAAILQDPMTPAESESEDEKPEGMITIDYKPSYRAEPYGTLASLQKRLHSDADRNLQHFI